MLYWSITDWNRWLRSVHARWPARESSTKYGYPDAGGQGTIGPREDADEFPLVARAQAIQHPGQSYASVRAFRLASPSSNIVPSMRSRSKNIVMSFAM
jgi:hypothetical protein